MENDAERLDACGGGCHLVVVNAILLGVAFCDISDFVARNVASVITLAPAHEFAFEGMFSRREV